MGRIPVIAAPTAAPMIAVSEIGVSMTRSCPKSSESPSVTVNPPPNPPETPTSSPRMNTEESLLIAKRMASRSASTMVILRLPIKSVPFQRRRGQNSFQWLDRDLPGQISPPPQPLLGTLAPSHQDLKHFADTLRSTIYELSRLDRTFAISELHLSCDIHQDRLASVQH